MLITHILRILSKVSSGYFGGFVFPCLTGYLQGNFSFGARMYSFAPTQAIDIALANQRIPTQISENLGKWIYFFIFY